MKLADLTLTPNLMCSKCLYDRRTVKPLPKTFPIRKLDEKLCEIKSDIVIYKGQTYICGIMDGGYALWECEV